MAYEGYPQEKGTVGIAFIITNDYEGDDALAGPQFDGKKWEKCLGDLCFDVRSKSNMSKENTIALYTNIPTKEYQSEDQTAIM
jgi:hypothetical protein